MADLPVDLPHPREPSTPAFAAYRDELVRHLGGVTRLD